MASSRATVRAGSESAHTEARSSAPSSSEPATPRSECESVPIDLRRRSRAEPAQETSTPACSRRRGTRGYEAAEGATDVSVELLRARWKPRVLEGSRRLSLGLSGAHRLNELRQHLYAPYRKRMSAKTLRSGRQTAQSEHVCQGRALSRRASRNANGTATLASAHPAATFRQIEHDAQTGPLELITKNAIHRRHVSVRHALQIKRYIVDGQASASST